MIARQRDGLFGSSERSMSFFLRDVILFGALHIATQIHTKQVRISIFEIIYVYDFIKIISYNKWSAVNKSLRHPF